MRSDKGTVSVKNIYWNVNHIFLIDIYVTIIKIFMIINSFKTRKIFNNHGLIIGLKAKISEKKLFRPDEYYVWYTDNVVIGVTSIWSNFIVIYIEIHLYEICGQRQLKMFLLFGTRALKSTHSLFEIFVLMQNVYLKRLI